MVESRQGEAKLGTKMSGSASASGIFTVLLKHLQNIDKSFQLYVVVIGNPHSYFLTGNGNQRRDGSFPILFLYQIEVK